MSHFTVLVIGDDHEALLAPFDENLEGVFDDKEDEYREEYENESRDMKRLPNGRLVSPWDKQFADRKGAGWSSSDTYTFPEGTVDVVIPFKELYSSFDEFMKEWHGSSERDEKTGKYGYWRNNEAKWDWYQVGGRWSGFLKLKAGATGGQGERSWTNENEADKPGTCDTALAGDIDWLGMLNERRDELTKQYDDVVRVMAGRPFKPWSEFLKDRDAGLIDIDEARRVYHEQQVLKDLTTGENPVLSSWGASDVIDEVVKAKDRAEYVDRVSRTSCITFAMVTPDGKWHEKGKMGWWAVHDATEESTQKFADFWWETVLNLPPDARVTLVDCHI
jgi:hypothetical protein